MSAGRLIGKFMVYYDRPHRYTSQEVELSAAIANHLASVIERFAAVSKLQETLHYQEIFAGILGHDLRNPLNAILTATQLLLRRQEGDGDRVTKPLGRILSSGERMARMIEQLLDFTRSRVGGGIQLHSYDTNLGDLCSQAVGELELAYPEWTVKQEAVGDLSGTWDSDRMLQVISNLVGNAGQHGEPDTGVLIRLDGTRSDAVTMEIRNGGHIPQSLLSTLFDPFRGTQHRRDQSRGLGLGLFITKEIVRAHGGTVAAISSESLGTTFKVVLPRTPSTGA